MITANQAQKTVKKVFPKATIQSMVRLKKGMINQNYSIKLKNPEKEVILRIYPKEGWKSKKEKYLYNLISKKTDIPVPKVCLVDNTQKIIGYNYSILSKIKGKELNKEYKKTKNKKLVEQAGEILAKIHSIKFPNFGWIVGTKIDPKFNSWSDFVFYDMGEKINKLSNIKKIRNNFIKKSIQYVEDRSNLLDVRSKPCLLHKDYHFSHILADESNITGIIDFEWAIAGHNELDLIKSIWWMFEAMPEIEMPFLKGYRRFGSLSNKFMKRKEVYELILLIGLIGFSYEKRNKKWFDYNLKKAKSIVGVK